MGTVKLSEHQLGLIAQSGTDGVSVYPGRGGNSAKGLERLGFGKRYIVELTGLRDRWQRPKSIWKTVYVNLRPGKALVCRTCEGRGGMDRMRPHIRDCAECGGLGAHQPEEAA